ncbi:MULTISPECIES: hypothetical protein [unclassified Microbacterium]|uniref:hypothetical protein n=1 Tax=unclassified Microbacterium TaxID=2609290 RepID=UPI0012FC3938|nr:hypothetical protein [Microbacterium sp. MAH-37]MVQ44089.1 hypothetical protein [Microbacterium sp. MAH-37]
MTTRLQTSDPLTLDAARRAGDAEYDRQWDLLLSEANYNPIHTRIVSGRAHRVRESLAYALVLFELASAGDDLVDGERRSDRGARVLSTVLDLQDTDPRSETYGLWGYWAEEPAAQMSPADWNWADFIGEFLILILRRHGETLAPELRGRAETALVHAARSIIRRDVDLDYTNIAVKGAFVTLAAGEITSEDSIAEYGRERLSRLHTRLLAQGSFAEYNSPTYWHVVLQAFTGIRQYVDDVDMHPLAADLERVAWEHFLRHWHPAAGQLSGPMARCYDTDLHLRPGVLSVLQRVAGDTWPLLEKTDLEPDIHFVQDAVLDYRIPADLRPLLDHVASADTVREVFADTFYIEGQVAGISEAAASGVPSVVVPTVGATWRDGALSLGSVNFSDTWLQRRPLLGYWVEPGDDSTDITRPARFVGVEVVRDGHGFAGGSFCSVQEDGRVLWALALATPSGDEHIHLDAIPAGTAVPTSDLRVRFRIRGASADAVRVDGEPLAAGASVADVSRVQVETPALHLDWVLAAARFDGAEVGATVTAGDDIVIDVPWLTSPRDLAVSGLGETFATGMLRMSAAPLDDAVVTAAVDGDVVRTAGAGLRLLAPVLPGSRLDHARIAQRARL